MRVKKADPQRQWFVVEDNTNEVWRYRRGGELGSEAIAQVVWENPNLAPVLLTGSDGKALLRQDAPGLPERIIVRVDDPLPPGPGGLHTSRAFSPAVPVEFVRESGTAEA
jgi:hypothetical protein